MVCKLIIQIDLFYRFLLLVAFFIGSFVPCLSPSRKTPVFSVYFPSVSISSCLTFSYVCFGWCVGQVSWSSSTTCSCRAWCPRSTPTTRKKASSETYTPQPFKIVVLCVMLSCVFFFLRTTFALSSGSRIKCSFCVVQYL